MNHKRAIIWIVILLALLMSAIIYYYEQPGAYTDNSTGNSTLLESHVRTWQLGDEILPHSFVDRKDYNCSADTLYSLYYIWNMGRDYKTKIMYGSSPWVNGQKHVWLEVSDNMSCYIYDLGYPLLNFELYQGREISYTKLLQYAYFDSMR